jgi:hypothetical protein
MPPLQPYSNFKYKFISNPLSLRMFIFVLYFSNPHIASSSFCVVIINLKHVKAPRVQLFEEKECFKWKEYKSHKMFQNIWLIKLGWNLWLKVMGLLTMFITRYAFALKARKFYWQQKLIPCANM